MTERGKYKDGGEGKIQGQQRRENTRMTEKVEYNYARYNIIAHTA
jgi:hypothetical protein